MILDSSIVGQCLVSVGKYGEAIIAFQKSVSLATKHSSEAAGLAMTELERLESIMKENPQLTAQAMVFTSSTPSSSASSSTANNQPSSSRRPGRSRTTNSCSKSSSTTKKSSNSSSSNSYIASTEESNGSGNTRHRQTSPHSAHATATIAEINRSLLNDSESKFDMESIHYHSPSQTIGSNIGGGRSTIHPIARNTELFRSDGSVIGAANRGSESVTSTRRLPSGAPPSYPQYSATTAVTSPNPRVTSSTPIRPTSSRRLAGRIAYDTSTPINTTQHSQESINPLDAADWDVSFEYNPADYAEDDNSSNNSDNDYDEPAFIAEDIDDSRYGQSSHVHSNTSTIHNHFTPPAQGTSRNTRSQRK